MARPASPAVVGYLLHGALPPAVALNLLDALGHYSPTIEPDLPDGCWLDLRVGQRGPTTQTQAAAILATAQEWGIAAPRVGVSPTPGVAQLAARHGADAATILDRESVPTFLAPLPVVALGLADDIVTSLAHLGLHTLGDLAALPPGHLGDNLGVTGQALDDLARGADTRPLIPRRPPLVLTAARDLDDWALTERDTLARLVRHLLAPLADQLRQRHLGATRATLRLTDMGGATRETIARLATPTASLAAIVAPLLDTLPLIVGSDDRDPDDEPGESAGAGIVAIAVALAAPRPLAVRQASFFDLPTGQRARAALGVAEARRRGTSQLGYLRLTDPASPFPDGRYTLDDDPPHRPEGWAAS